MQAFKLNKLFVATALALAFGPGVRVVDAASLCGIPGASQMGMGCGGNTGTADSTLVPNVGPAPQLPNGGSTFLPSGGGINTTPWLLAFKGLNWYQYPQDYPYQTVVSPDGSSVQIYDVAYGHYLAWSASAQPGSQVIPLDSSDFLVPLYPNYTDYLINQNVSGFALDTTSQCVAQTSSSILYGSGIDFTGPQIQILSPYNPYYGGCTCFPAGSMVLMADGIEKRIEHVRIGDWIMGADGKPVQIHQIDTPILGNRRMMSMTDGSLLWSEEHAMWTRDAAHAEWWWSANPEAWRAEVAQGAIGGLHDNASMREGEGYAFAHMTGWIEKGVIEAQGYGPDTQLYLPMTNGVPIIVNGYAVGAGVNEDGYDYKALRWSPERIVGTLARQALARVMRHMPSHASSAVVAEAMV